MAWLISPKAREVVRRSIQDLSNHICRQFIECRSNKMDLQAGVLAASLKARRKKAALSLSETWASLFDLCVSEFIMWPKPTAAKGFAFNASWPLLYELEKSGKEGHFIFQTSFKIWKGQIEDYSSGSILKEITYFCDWVESSISLNAYLIFKSNKNCFQEDRFAASINYLMDRLKELGAVISPVERNAIARNQLDSLGVSFGRMIADYEAYSLYDPEPVKWKHPRLDCWLFQIWPLVKHFHWTKKELLRVIIEKNVSNLGQRLDIDLSQNPCKSPMALGNHCREVLGLHDSESKRGQPPKRETGDLPPRYALALNL